MKHGLTAVAFLAQSFAAADDDLIYKKEGRRWLDSEVEYGCQVAGSADFMSFGFDSKLLPAVTLVYWKKGQGGQVCGDFRCPPGYGLLWTKRFYRSDFQMASVHFNGMSLSLKLSAKDEVLLGEIRFMEKEPSTLRVANHRQSESVGLICERSQKPQGAGELVEIVKKWRVDVCEEEKKDQKNPRLSGPSIIGGGGDINGEVKKRPHNPITSIE